MNEERFHRQLDLLPLTVLHEPITVIGAGAVGSFVTLTLAKMGFDRITVWDDDAITEHNLPNQFFRTKDVGRLKVEALKELVKDFEDVDIDIRPERFENSDLNGIVVSAVDVMDARKKVFKAVECNPAVRFYLDPRMGGQLSLLYSLEPIDIEACMAYKETLHSDEDAAEDACTARAILYTVLSIASLVSNFVRCHLVGEKVPFAVQRCHATHETMKPDVVGVTT